MAIYVQTEDLEGEAKYDSSDARQMSFVTVPKGTHIVDGFTLNAEFAVVLEVHSSNRHLIIEGSRTDLRRKLLDIIDELEHAPESLKEI